MGILKSFSPFTDAKGKLPFELVRPEIRKVEKQIADQVNAFDPGVAPYIDYICNTSGKRIRPALAILIGDALFSHALLLATEFDDIEINRKVGRASREVCEGEVIQSQRRFDLTLTKEDYFKVISMKTGALFAAATGISANLSGADEATEKALYDYGMKLGTAYQIYDDCVDLIGTEDDIGKTLGTDLEKGKLTLPMLTLLENATDDQRTKLNKRIIEQEALDFEVLVGIADYAGAIEDALDTAAEMLTDARNDLTCLADSKYTTGLIDITAYLDDLINKCRK